MFQSIGTFFQTILISLLLTCKSLMAGDVAPAPATAESWEITKSTQIPKNELPALYDTPHRQQIATLAWEDGVYITRDGLTLYAAYFPADVLAALFGGAIPVKTYLYRRGPDIGQDFRNPLGQPSPWIHADIAYATRSSTNVPFSPWVLTSRKGTPFNQGAPQGILNHENPKRFDYFVYTSDANKRTTILLLRDTDRRLAGDGKELPANVDDPRYHEDNPHIEQYNNADPRRLVLFFDSDDWPGKGKHDIWYTLSDDGRGDKWSDPRPVSSINTEDEEEQPHLYRDGNQWWLYFTATNPADHKLAIYRARQGEEGNWDSWVDKELVISAGTAQGVGEPTLTSEGDLSFVVVTYNEHGTSTDQYDCDPWFMARAKPGKKHEP